MVETMLELFQLFFVIDASQMQLKFIFTTQAGISVVKTIEKMTERYRIARVAELSYDASFDLLIQGKR